MKKTLAILLSVLLILAVAPMVAMVGTAESAQKVWDQFFVTSEGANVTDCTVTSGSITFTATLPSAGSYVQLNQKLTDLFDGAEFTVGTADAETCFLQLTADASAKTDIVPVAENSGQNPGTVGMTWLVYKSGNFVVFGRGANTAGLGAYLSTYGRFNSTGGVVGITFGIVDEKVTVTAPKFTPVAGYNCGFDNYAPSTKTADEVGLTDGGYFRLRNRDNAARTFTITVKSKDISPAYRDGNFILSDFDSKVNSSSVTYADGKATYTYNVTLATKDSYVQFDKKLSDLFTDAKFAVGTVDAETCYLQLTADASAKTDIVPVAENSGQNPGTVGMTWLIYKSGNFVVFGRGVNTAGLGAYLSTYGRFKSDNGVQNIRFGIVDEKVAVTADKFTTSGYNCGFDNYAPSTKTAQEVGLTDGGYFRLRNRDNAARTFTVNITTVDNELRPITVNGGTANVETAAYGNSVSLNYNEKPGYEFMGWKVVSGGVEVVDNAFVMGSAPVEVEALFEKIPYTLTVDGALQETTYCIGDTVTLTAPGAAVGYTFAGWNVVSGGVEIAENSFVMGAENVVVESVFEKIKYTVTVDGNDKAANYGDTVTLIVPEAAAGYTFAGWKVVSGGVEIAENSFVMGTENVVIESIFEKIPYTLTKDGALQDGTYYIGDTVTLEDAEVPSDAKFVEFDKWVIVSGEGAKIDGNVLTIGAGNVEIKATYKAVAPYGDVRDLVRFDELGADAPGVADDFAALYAKDGVLTLNSIKAYLLQNK